MSSQRVCCVITQQSKLMQASGLAIGNYKMAIMRSDVYSAKLANLTFPLIVVHGCVSLAVRMTVLL